MQTHSLRLTDQFTNTLLSFPENGMGYQVVKVILKSGEVLRRHKVINAELLMLNEDEKIKLTDIDKIEPEGK